VLSSIVATSDEGTIVLESAIEKDFKNRIAALRNYINEHDRGVVIGMAFCCVPLIPVTLFGLIVCSWNLFLVKQNQLEITEMKPIKLAFSIGFFNLFLGTFVAVFIYSIIIETGIYVPTTIRIVADFIIEVIRFMWGVEEPNLIGAYF